MDITFTKADLELTPLLETRHKLIEKINQLDVNENEDDLTKYVPRINYLAGIALVENQITSLGYDLTDVAEFAEKFF